MNIILLENQKGTIDHNFLVTNEIMGIMLHKSCNWNYLFQLTKNAVDGSYEIGVKCF